MENQSAEAISVAKVMELGHSFIDDGSAFKIVVPHRRFIIESDTFLFPNNQVNILNILSTTKR